MPLGFPEGQSVHRVRRPQQSALDPAHVGPLPDSLAPQARTVHFAVNGDDMGYAMSPRRATSRVVGIQPDLVDVNEIEAPVPAPGAQARRYGPCLATPAFLRYRCRPRKNSTGDDKR